LKEAEMKSKELEALLDAATREPFANDTDQAVYEPDLVDAVVTAYWEAIEREKMEQ
jgi:hypothetical protein